MASLRFQKGFTLLELMLVVAVLAILAGIGFGIYSNDANANVVGTTQQSIISDLRTAREKALNGESFLNWGMHFDGTANNYQLFSSPTTYADASKTIISTTYLTNGITFTAPATGTTTDVVFNKITGASSAATITITAQGVSKNIAVSAAGLVDDGTAPGGGSSGPTMALVQKASAAQVSGVSANLAVSLPAVSSGDTLVVAVSSWPAAPVSTSISDSAGNLYSLIGTVQHTVNLGQTAMYYAKNANAGNTTITFGLSGSSNEMSIVAAEFSGPSTTAPLDTSLSTAGSGAATAPSNLTPAGTPEILVAAVTHDDNVTTTAGTGFGMVAIASDDTNTHQPLAMEWQALNALTPIPGTFNFSVAASWAETEALLK